MVMIFAVKEAKEQLLNHDAVITFREHPHSTGKDWATDKRGGQKLCDIWVSQLKISDDAPTEPPTWIEDIKPFWGLSGFSSYEKWEQVITAITQKSRTFNGFGYLYLVIKEKLT